MNSTSFALGLTLILEALSAFAAAFLVYAAFLVMRDKWKGAQAEKEQEQRDTEVRALKSAVWRGVAFLSSVLLVLVAIHVAARQYGMVAAAVVLFAGLAVCAIIYFDAVRKYWNDDRIQYTVLLWSAFWILIGLLMLFVSWAVDKGAVFEVDKIDAPSLAQYVATVAQIASIIIAATMVVVTNRHNAREADETARQQIYQTLELESVKLFRFECEHDDLVQMLWFSDPEAKGALERIAKGAVANLDNVSMEMRVKLYQLKQYTCQILNLFEMACKFRKQGVIDADIFGSWVIWMWELSAEPMFQLQWKGEKGIEFNYISELRDIINAGVHFNTAQGDHTESGRMHAFYNFVASQMFPDDEDRQHRLVKRWLDTPSDHEADYAKYWP